MFENPKILISLIIMTLLTGYDLHSQNDKDSIQKPQVIDPGNDRNAPSDAIILFDKGSLEHFESVNDSGEAGWNVRRRSFTVVPGAGNIQTKRSFGDCQLHIEWKTPVRDVRKGKEGQQNGNSGIYLMGKYEVQVLNSYENETNKTGQAGAIYGFHPPMVNASLEPGKWQTYDIVFRAPKFNSDGKLLEPGYMTIFHNGVLIQDHSEITAPTPAHNEDTPIDAEKLPLMLQDHNSEVSYRNIWIREL